MIKGYLVLARQITHCLAACLIFSAVLWVSAGINYCAVLLCASQSLSPFKLHSAHTPVHTHTHKPCCLPHYPTRVDLELISHLLSSSPSFGGWNPLAHTPTTLSHTSLLWTPILSSKRPSKHVFCFFLPFPGKGILMLHRLTP